MKNLRLITVCFTVLIFCLTVLPTRSQSSFSLDNYLAVVEQNKNLEASELLQRHSPQNDYYYMVNNATPLGHYLYLDTIVEKYELSRDELMLLFENRFVVTERLSFPKMVVAMDDIFCKDLPFFVTTDAILHALHLSYSNLIKQTEREILLPNLKSITERLYYFLPQMAAKYDKTDGLYKSLCDVDLYVTVAYNLLYEDPLPPQIISNQEYQTIWDAINNEQFAEIPLFTDMSRMIDFSQFTVRGHYLNNKDLESYFRCMMWFGRAEFVLANAPPEWYINGFTNEGLKRLNISSIMLNELVEEANVQDYLQETDDILEALIGKSDNLRPSELSDFIADQGIANPDELMSDNIFEDYLDALLQTSEYGQQILSSCVSGYIPSDPTPLPFSFRLLGQRYIIDSHILANVVYDNIIYQDQKICRMMPDPLDAMFALGNDNALQLLDDELNTWNYSSNLANMRYLTDLHDNSFWGSSYYNAWLNSIRLLYPSTDQSEWPLFMKTVAWQQQKINTQLASWAQLRHDNLLYTKQSYTHCGACSYPHSYVEPYPEFYRQIGILAEKALEIEAFERLPYDGMTGDQAVSYFIHLKETMDILAVIADKELSGTELAPEEVDFLQRMLFAQGMSGPKYNGWYIKLLYGSDGDPDMEPYSSDDDYVVADVHTQPTTCRGAVVGKILHVGMGNVNLGIFLAESPSRNFQPMAYIGPVMSYYETITDNFERITDQEWCEKVKINDLPERPDWVNVYLVDSMGNRRPPGRELAGVVYTNIENRGINNDNEPDLNIYPNPVAADMVIKYHLSGSGLHEIGAYNLNGQFIERIFMGDKPDGIYKINWNTSRLPSGVYFIRLKTQKGTVCQKIIKQ